MFWQSLQVTFEIVVTLLKLEPVFFWILSKWTFWIYIDGINRTKGPFVMFMGHIGVPKKEARRIFIFAFCVTPAGLKYLLFTEVLSSDNSIVCFRRKALLKPDMLAGFTTSVALICYLACVI